MPKNIIHISEVEAASDFAAVLARVRAGAEVVIEGREPITVRAEPVRGRMLSDCIALAKAHEEETGRTPVLDSDFAADVEEIVKRRVAPTDSRGRLLSESLRLAKGHASTATLDGDFARDVEDVINSHREPLTPPKWD